MRQNRKVILLAFAIAAFNQLSGINAILYYAPDIFRSAGAGDNAAALESVIVGLVNLIVTMAALTVIDKIGRRRLMLVGSIGYLVSLGVLAGCSSPTRASSPASPASSCWAASWCSSPRTPSARAR